MNGDFNSLLTFRIHYYDVTYVFSSTRNKACRALTLSVLKRSLSPVNLSIILCIKSENGNARRNKRIAWFFYQLIPVGFVVLYFRMQFYVRRCECNFTGVSAETKRQPVYHWVYYSTFIKLSSIFTLGAVSGIANPLEPMWIMFMYIQYDIFSYYFVRSPMRIIKIFFLHDLEIL